MASIITLQQAKEWLRYPNPSAASSDDSAIQSVIDAAQQILESKVGVTVPALFDELYTPSGSKLWLRNTPVLEIVEVFESWQIVNFELDLQASTTGPTIANGVSDGATAASKMWAYSLDEPVTGEVTRRGPANIPLPFYPSDRGIRVVYRAGRNPITPAIILAAKELVAHIWQNAELRAVATTAGFLQYDATEAITRDVPGGAQAFWVGVPQRIIGLLESEMTGLPFMA